MATQTHTKLLPLVKVLMPPEDELIPILTKVLYSGMIAEGEYVYSFEREFSKLFSLDNCLAMSSGTAALHAALLLSGAGPQTEVISTSMTAEPTNTSILQTGAKVVWADVDPETGNLSVDSVENSITESTKAIVCVHYAGYPCDLDSLRALADKYNLKLIEDCAHALGAQYKEKPIGSYGDFSIFSFQAIKHMTTIDGGMLVIKDSTLIENAKKIRWFGMLKGVPRTEIDINIIGYKYNMNNVAAALGLLQLQNINSVVKRHKDNGHYFDNALKSISGINLVKLENGADPSYWLYTLFSEDSEDVERTLAAAGVSASKLHKPNHLHSIFTSSFKSLPGVNSFYSKLVHIPCGWWVTDEDREKILKVLKNG